METDQKNQMLFTELVLMFHTAAMQQMGKIRHPATGKIERHLESAQNSIDLLDMLQAKTRGNLSGEEERFLKQVVQELKLNYVDELQKPAPETGSTPT
jgi:hypothetical protein